MVERVRELWQQGYDDKQMAEQLTTEGFHSARSPHVTPMSVMKIRLAHRWYLPFERMRGIEEVDGYLTARGLAKRLVASRSLDIWAENSSTRPSGCEMSRQVDATKRLGVNDSTVYRFIYNEIIPPEAVKRDPQAGVYLIRNDAELIERLQQRISDNKRKNGMFKPTPST